MKKFLCGVLVTALLLTTIVSFAAPGVMREVFYGVRVSVNGVVQNFDEDMTPFITGDRTFLPVRGVAEALGADVDFDFATNTVLLTVAQDGAPALATSPTPLTQSFFHSSAIDSELFGAIGGGPNDGTAFVRTQDTVNMGGQYFNHAIAFRSGRDDPAQGQYSSHRLGGRYTTLVGTIGRIDGPGQSGGTLWRIWGDGVVLAQFDHSISDGRTINDEAPREIEVDVSGVDILTIEVTIWSHQQRAEFAFAGETR